MTYSVVFRTMTISTKSVYPKIDVPFE